MCFVLQCLGPIQVPRWGAIPARPGPILLPSVPSRIGPGLASSCAPYKIQNPSEAQNTPQNTPRILSRNQNTEKIRKKYENPRFCTFFVFFSYLVSGRGSGCILGCILALRGVLYSVGGARTRKPGQAEADFLATSENLQANPGTSRPKSRDIRQFSV